MHLFIRRQTITAVTGHMQINPPPRLVAGANPGGIGIWVAIGSMHLLPVYHTHLCGVLQCFYKAAAFRTIVPTGVAGTHFITLGGVVKPSSEPFPW